MERSLIGILGASGKVGQLVCDYLVRNTGYVVKAGYRKTIPFLFNGRLRWQFVDIQDKQKLFEFCRDCKIIINCIGSSRNINLNLAFMAHEVGAIYIDTYGTGKLKKELVNRDIVNSGCYILGAGVYPGLTGIAMNYLVKKYPSIKKWKGMAGSYEPIGTGAAEDLLYSCLYGFGIENAYWKHGQIKVPKRKEIEEIYIPQLQKTKNIALFLPDEILQIAKENDLEKICWYNILPNKEHMAIMKKAYQKLLQRNDIATEIQEFEEITRKSTEHWNIISFNSDDAEVGQILVKLEISNTSAYKMTGIVAALLAIRSAQTKRKSGIWNAYETIQMQYVFEKLQEEGVFIKETQEVSTVYEESEETGIL